MTAQASAQLERSRLRRPREKEPKELTAQVATIRGGFAEYLRGLGYASITIDHYQRHLSFVAGWLEKHPKRGSLDELSRGIVLCLLHDILPGRRPETLINYRKAVFHWLRFQGRYTEPIRAAPWLSWLNDYLHFLTTHRGVGPATIEPSVVTVRAFLDWQFGNSRVSWTRVQAGDIWRFASHHVRGLKPRYAKVRLGCLRRFLRFAVMKGACSPQIEAAVPKVAAYGDSPRPAILSDQQRRQLLASFPRRLPEGKRNYAMTLCMLDLGLRSAEVIRMRLPDIDWRRRMLHIPKTKTGRGRQLPIPKRVLSALKVYVMRARPANGLSDHVFVRHPRRRGHPLSRPALKEIVHRAYRRCGFPRSWSGTHRLRHTFATRLYRRGIEIKPIADLLGHRWLDSTNRYTRVDLEALRALAQPWPPS
jgi:integrase/recombinase XerD